MQLKVHYHNYKAPFFFFLFCSPSFVAYRLQVTTTQELQRVLPSQSTRLFSRFSADHYDAGLMGVQQMRTTCTERSKRVVKQSITIKTTSTKPPLGIKNLCGAPRRGHHPQRGSRSETSLADDQVKISYGPTTR